MPRCAAMRSNPAGKAGQSAAILATS
jgi:hypothetical protein